MISMPRFSKALSAPNSTQKYNTYTARKACFELEKYNVGKNFLHSFRTGLGGFLSWGVSEGVCVSRSREVRDMH